MIGERPTFTPQDFEFYRREGEAKRKGVDVDEAGPITPYTTDKEIAGRAARIAYNTAGGSNPFLPDYVLKLERRIASLEARVSELENAKLPHMRKAERR